MNNIDTEKEKMCSDRLLFKGDYSCAIKLKAAILNQRKKPTLRVENKVRQLGVYLSLTK